MKPVGITAVSAVLAIGAMYAGAASAQSQNVQVVRGGQPAAITVTREANVQVFRGAPATMRADKQDQVASVEKSGDAVSSGSRIWLIDRAAGKLSVCRLVSTTQIGKQRIDCHSRALPL